MFWIFLVGLSLDESPPLVNSPRWKPTRTPLPLSPPWTKPGGCCVAPGTPRGRETRRGATAATASRRRWGTTPLGLRCAARAERFVDLEALEDTVPRCSPRCEGQLLVVFRHFPTSCHRTGVFQWRVVYLLTFCGQVSNKSRWWFITPKRKVWLVGAGAFEGGTQDCHGNHNKSRAISWNESCNIKRVCGQLTWKERCWLVSTPHPVSKTFPAHWYGPFFYHGSSTIFEAGPLVGFRTSTASTDFKVPCTWLKQCSIEIWVSPHIIKQTSQLPWSMPKKACDWNRRMWNPSTDEA